MDAALKSYLGAWHWRPDVLLVLVVLGSVYVCGWRRLRGRGRARGPAWWQLVLYLGGLLVVSIALLSPIEGMVSLLFLVHMIQHMLLMMVAAPLLLLANPLPAFLWGLPRTIRRGVGRLLTRNAPFRRGLRALTLMPVAWAIYVVNLWVWHVPAAYQAALRNDLIHDLEHIAFFLTALLFWFPVISPAPRLHRHIHHGLRIVYVVAATGQNTLLGALIALTDRVLYPYYSAAPRIWGLTALEDQIWAGAIMWEGGIMYVIATVVLVARMSAWEEQVARRQPGGLIHERVRP